MPTWICASWFLVPLHSKWHPAAHYICAPLGPSTMLVPVNLVLSLGQGAAHLEKVVNFRSAEHRTSVLVSEMGMSQHTPGRQHSTPLSVCWSYILCIVWHQIELQLTDWQTVHCFLGLTRTGVKLFPVLVFDIEHCISCNSKDTTRWSLENDSRVSDLHHAEQQQCVLFWKYCWGWGCVVSFIVVQKGIQVHLL